MPLKSVLKPVSTHALVMLLAACGGMATLNSDQCTAESDGLDDSDLFEASVSSGLQAQTLPTTSTGDLAQAVADRTGLTNKQAGEAINALFAAMTESFQANKRVELYQFGSLTPKVRKARTYRNPKTGGTVERPVVTYLSWKTSETLKAKLPVP